MGLLKRIIVLNLIYMMFISCNFNSCVQETELSSTDIGYAVQRMNDVFDLAEKYNTLNSYPSYFGRVKSACDLYYRKYWNSEDEIMSKKISNFRLKYYDRIVVPLLDLCSRESNNLKFIGMNIIIIDSEKENECFLELKKIIQLEKEFRKKHICP